MDRPALMSETLGDASIVYRGGFSGVRLRSWPFSLEMLDSNIVCDLFLCAGLVWSIFLHPSKVVSTFGGIEEIYIEVRRRSGPSLESFVCIIQVQT